MLKVVGIAAAAFVGLIVLGAIVGEPDTGSATAESQAFVDEQPIAARPVTATELYRAYEANEQAAQLQYGGQPLEVSGRITSIQLDFLDQPVVSLQAGGPFAEVTLQFTDEHAAITAQLVRG